MAINKYFLTQVKRTNGTVEKGVVVKDSPDEVLQSLYSYLGAYAYGNDKNTDYVYVEAVNEDGAELDKKKWEKAIAEQQS